MKAGYLWFMLCCLITLCKYTSSFAQGVKQEKETSIARSAMPQQAILLLKELLADARKVNYYYETDGNQVSYECKLQWYGNTYSIEFFEDGSLMDIEKLINIGALPEKVRNTIQSYLAEHFQKTKIRRLQLQFTAEDAEESDQEMIKQFMEHDADDLTIRYEMEVNTKNDRKINAYEMLFDRDGHYMQQRKIVRRNLDNILY